MPFPRGRPDTANTNSVNPDLLGPDPSIVNASFKDAWNLTHGPALSLTCCQDENLKNIASKLSVRYDLVFVKGLSVLDARAVGDKSIDKTPSGFWPSDHAGVIATLR